MPRPRLSSRCCWPGERCRRSERLCLGDWCWARGVELAIEHNLPFKLHTGYYAGTAECRSIASAAGHLCALLARYPQARFVLMHIAYPTATNWWRWRSTTRTSTSISAGPGASTRTARAISCAGFIHAVPINKLFAFGGDTSWPAAAVAYAGAGAPLADPRPAGRGGRRLLTERQAIGVATRLMQTNQHECFDIEGTRAAIRRELAGRT